MSWKGLGTCIWKTLDAKIQTKLKVLADYENESLPVHVVYQEGRKAAAKVRAFIDFAVERLRALNSIN